MLSNFKIWAFVLCMMAAFCAGNAMRGKVEEAKHAKALRAAIEEHAAREQAAYEKSAALEAELTQQRAIERKLKGQLYVEISKNRVYRDCVVPDNGVRILNDAIAGRDTSGESDSQL